MKKFFLLFFGISVFLVQAQQVSVMQPAIKNSDLKLDSIYIQREFAIRNSIDSPTEKWYVKQYDSDKNPIEFMVHHINESSQEVIDSTKVTLEHYQINNYFSDFRNQLFAEEGLSIFSHFNIKSAKEEIYNPITNVWLLKSYREFFRDTRLANPNGNGANYLINSYDTEYNIIGISKVESIIELDRLGYNSEQTHYTWNINDGFTTSLKYVYHNTYDTDNNLIESIKRRIFDFTTNEEINISKQIYTYTEELFEYTSQIWNPDINDWYPINRKFNIEYDLNGSPINKSEYQLIDGEWNLLTTDVNNYIFNVGLFKGFFIDFYFDFEALTLEYNSDNLIISDIYQISGDGFGTLDQKEFYYSSDQDLISVDDFNLTTISVYPNPATSEITLNLSEEVNYTIYTLQGRKTQKGVALNRIDLKNLKSGIYFLHLKLSESVITKRLIIK